MEALFFGIIIFGLVYAVCCGMRDAGEERRRIEQHLRQWAFEDATREERHALEVKHLAFEREGRRLLAERREAHERQAREAQEQHSSPTPLAITEA